MRWFKHMSISHTDEKLSEFTDLFGAEGYGVYWTILEMISLQIDDDFKTFSRYLLKKWINSCKISQKKFVPIVNHLESVGLLLLEYDGDYLKIDCPNLIKFRDEWTSRRKKLPSNSRVTPELPPPSTPEQLPSNSRATREPFKELELDPELEEEKKEGIANTAQVKFLVPSEKTEEGAALQHDPNFYDVLASRFPEQLVKSPKVRQMVAHWKLDGIEIQDLIAALEMKNSGIATGEIKSPIYFDSLVREFWKARTQGYTPPAKFLTNDERKAQERSAQKARILAKDKFYQANVVQEKTS